MNPLALIVAVIAAITAPQLTQTDNKGLIGYFDRDCPEGWENYAPLEDRFPLASSDMALVNATGGSEEHVLTVDEMPDHKHRTGVAGISPGTAQVAYELSWTNDNYLAIVGSSYNYYPQLYSSEKGKNQPHNNMPPLPCPNCL